MLRGKRDSYVGSPAHAIATVDEIEGRTLVLRVVAIVALTRLLKRYDERGKAELIAALRRAIIRKCGHAKLTEADTSAASEYARTLLEEALLRADAGTAAQSG